MTQALLQVAPFLALAVVTIVAGLMLGEVIDDEASERVEIYEEEEPTCVTPMSNDDSRLD